MNIHDAAKILNLSGAITPDAVKRAYRQACSKYHPDRNPAGEEMMKAVNAAYEVLQDFTGKANEDSTGDYSQGLNDAITFALGLSGVIVELCGAWVWLSGDTKQHREALKHSKNSLPDGYGYRWAPKKKMWYYRPADWSSKSYGTWSIDEIRTEHGSTTIKSKRELLTA